MGYCCRNFIPKTKTATLIFKRSDLLYDAENYAFVEGDIMKDEDEHSKHQVFDIGQEGNVDRVTRVLNLAHSECVEMLFPYTKEEIPDEQNTLDDVLTEPEEYKIELTLPQEFSLSTLKLLEHLIHEYMVCKIMADWMSITNPQKTKSWETKLHEVKDKIQTSLLSRRTIIYRKTRPF